MDDELLEIVDENNNVIGIEKRSVIHQRKLYHRSVQILLFNSKNELFIQQRALNKDIYPGLFGFSVGGHVDIGESYEQAALREIKEELGIDLKPQQLKLIKVFPPCKENMYEFAAVFIAYNIDQEPKINTHEVASGMFVPLDKLKLMLQEHQEKFCPDFKLVFRQLLEQQVL